MADPNAQKSSSAPPPASGATSPIPNPVPDPAQSTSTSRAPLKLEIDTVRVDDNRKMTSREALEAHLYLMAKLKDHLPQGLQTPEAYSVMLGPITYFFRMRTTSPKAESLHSGVHFRLNGQDVSIDEKVLIDAIMSMPSLASYPNKCRIWARTNEKAYVEFSRAHPGLPGSSRSALTLALPKQYSWLEADFLSGEYLQDNERAALMLATERATQAVSTEAQITSLRQLGRPLLG